MEKPTAFYFLSQSSHLPETHNAIAAKSDSISKQYNYSNQFKMTKLVLGFVLYSSLDQMVEALINTAMDRTKI